MKPKKWYKSTGGWANILTTVLGAYMTAQAMDCTGLDACLNLPPVPPQVVAVLGLFGLYGRKRAEGPLTL